MSKAIGKVQDVVQRLRWARVKHTHRVANRFAKCDCIFVRELLGKR